MSENCYQVEYIDETHQYLINGVLVPSVTQLLHKKFGGMYDNIPPQILADKAKFGDMVHRSIECIEKDEERPMTTLYEELCVKQYLRLKDKYNINSIENEMLVHYEDKFAGRLDMIADVNYYRCLCDIKTTAKLNKEYLSWQLSLYELALESMGYPKLEKLYCIWLPKKDLGQLVEVPRINREELIKFVEENTNE